MDCTFHIYMTLGCAQYGKYLQCSAGVCSGASIMFASWFRHLWERSVLKSLGPLLFSRAPGWFLVEFGSLRYACLLETNSRHFLSCMLVTILYRMSKGKLRYILYLPGVTLGPITLRAAPVMEDVRDLPFITELFTIDLLGNDRELQSSDILKMAATDYIKCISL